MSLTDNGNLMGQVSFLPSMIQTSVELSLVDYKVLFLLLMDEDKFEE